MKQKLSRVYIGTRFVYEKLWLHMDYTLNIRLSNYQPKWIMIFKTNTINPYSYSMNSQYIVLLIYAFISKTYKNLQKIVKIMIWQTKNAIIGMRKKFCRFKKIDFWWKKKFFFSGKIDFFESADFFFSSIGALFDQQIMLFRCFSRFWRFLFFFFRILYVFHLTMERSVSVIALTILFFWYLDWL